MRTSRCQELTNVCNAKVFATNPFHILGLSPFSNAKAVRRRKEELQFARDSAVSWKSEFKHLLANTPVPTADQVDEAFRRIEDPLKRIVDEFFWFWPLDERDDEALEMIFLGKGGKAERIWKKEEKSGNIARSVSAKHNLAVYNQFYAIDTELQFIDTEATEKTAPEEHRLMCEFWQEAFSRWEVLADDDDLWDIVKARVRDIGDQRLTSGFIRRMRDEFPIAFDRINGDLAIGHAKILGHESDTERHLRYMNETHQGLDDVQATLDAILDPMEREVDLLVREADRVINISPHSALSAARDLLKNTKGVRRIVYQLLPKDNRLRNKIFDKIAATCNHCQVAYGNATKQWEECLSFIKTILPLACDNELIDVIKKNLEIVTDNYEAYKREHFCWFCQDELAIPELAEKIEMYGDVKVVEVSHYSDAYKATWRNITVNIPKCKKCKNAEQAQTDENNRAWQGYQDARRRRNGWYKFWDVETDETTAALQAYRKIQQANEKRREAQHVRSRKFPLYLELKKLGFKEGKKPSQSECDSLARVEQGKLARFYGRISGGF